ncbi:phenylalanine-4-hydroxylase [Alkalibacillus filiformis]|uniref:Phenylalanine-4-hydroxylase n=1 Tax=Alkalibacillus filiformis TaxID=200990 RepID=A0ABU0DUH5_9BACI|nr:aromatic amino acid hydroxylase [Alkalibacillus filiformis]MDQ0352112.1 phenylalanine-4-hydroxylase [Alkalibacillus filiformis]
MQTVETKSVPKHLRKYTAEQHYEHYTAINHAVWRYVMRQNHNLLKDTAHEAYTDGLKASSISIDKIPNVDEMNESLAPSGWGAATIDGFIPGVAFFEFQAQGILPVVNEIRKLENILYTPAPDIIHEAAGHAPILADPEYSAFVKRFGEIGMKAIATKEEHDHFEAVRNYSNLLEKGNATEEEINQAKQEVDECEAKITELSEAQIVGRFYWWTVEFGLVGDLDDPKIYGAGLLSSVGEGSNALSDEVEKMPFDMDAVINTGFDITKPQPHLFVCKDFKQLLNAAEEFAKTMSFMKGGTESLEKAVRSANTATAVFSSGLQVTGVFTELLKDDQGEAIYLKTNGETALAASDQQLENHGTDVHADGFGAPIGQITGLEKPLEDLSDDELKNIGVQIGNDTELNFENGIQVNGKVTDLVRHHEKLVLISLEDCTVTKGDQALFKPEWGTFDLAVGTEITSVYAGAADGENYYNVDEAQKTPIPEKTQVKLNELYARLRSIRDNGSNNLVADLQPIHEQLKEDHPKDWLLRLEMVELLSELADTDLKQTLLDELNKLKRENEEFNTLIERGLSIV